MAAEYESESSDTATRRAAMDMYETPRLYSAYGAWWRRIAASLRAAGVTGVPDELSRNVTPEEMWADPGLLLAQTCGYPLMTVLRGRVRYVATPHYEAPGCDGPYYRSFVLVRTDDPAAGLHELRGRIAAFNMRGSQSGYNVLRAMVAPLAEAGRFFERALETGSHRDSMEFVRRGRADVCAVDCVSHALWQDHDPGLTAGLRILVRSPATPGLPLIASLATADAEIDALRRALQAAASDPALRDVNRRLRIGGFSTLDVADYHAVLEMKNVAIAADYEVLH